MFARLEGTSANLEMIDIIAEFFSELSLEQGKNAAYLLRGEVTPDYEGPEFGLASKMVIRALAYGKERSEEEVERMFNEHGDLGTVAALLAEEREESDLTLETVFQELTELAFASGEGSQEEKLRILSNLVGRATPQEGKYIVRVVLGTGRFDWTDTRLTAAALALFSLSIVFQGLMLLFVRGYYAAGNTRTPFIVNMVSGALIVIFAVGLWYLFRFWPAFAGWIERLLRVDGLEGTSVLMLPLGYTLGFFVNGMLLWLLFQRDFGRKLFEPLRAFWQSLAAAVLTGFVAYVSLNALAPYFASSTVAGVFLHGLLSGVIGTAIGAIVLALLGNREFYEMWDAVKQRMWKTHVVAPDSDSIDG